MILLDLFNGFEPFRVCPRALILWNLANGVDLFESGNCFALQIISVSVAFSNHLQGGGADLLACLYVDTDLAPRLLCRVDAGPMQELAPDPMIGQPRGEARVADRSTATNSENYDFVNLTAAAALQSVATY